MTSYEYLTVDSDAHVTIVHLNRPQARNALSYDVLAEIELCAHNFRDDTDTRVVIFAANGPHFSAGADLKEMSAMNALPLIERRRRLRMGERALRALMAIDQITICAWNGGAIGGGGCIANALDFRIGAEDCYFYLPEIDLGLNLMWQSIPRLVRIVGEPRAMRMAVGGERVEAETLLNWGMLEGVVANEQLLDRAIAFAQTYVNKPPIAAQMIKRSINAVGAHLDQALMHIDADQHALTLMTSDQRVAARAYADKQQGEFTGN